MHVTFACPACEQPVRQTFTAESAQLACPACHHVIRIPPDAVQLDRVRRCLVCPSTDLFVRKDFPQRVGVALVVVGIIGSSIAWAYTQVFWTFAILFASALADFLLYACVGNALMCYRCQAQYRGVAQMDSHGSFDLETHERHRQINARMKSVG